VGVVVSIIYLDRVKGKKNPPVFDIPAGGWWMLFVGRVLYFAVRYRIYKMCGREV